VEAGNFGNRITLLLMALLLDWAAMATLYFSAGLAGRLLHKSGSESGWGLACGGRRAVPGALFMAVAIVLYGLGGGGPHSPRARGGGARRDRIGLCVGRVIASPRHPKFSPERNPFALSQNKTGTFPHLPPLGDLQNTQTRAKAFQ